MDLATLLGQGGGRPEIWTASATIEQGALVLSPLDKEVYRRIAATGASSTDPADDLTNYVAASYVRPSSLPVGYAISMPGNQIYGVSKTAQVNIAQGARTQVLSVTGRGQILHIGHFRSYGAMSSTRMEVWVDGRKMLDWEDVFNGTHYGCSIGNVIRTSDGAVSMAGQPVAFRRSVALWLTPTDQAWPNDNFVGYSLRTEA